MNASTMGHNVGQLDYNNYERLLQKIKSVQLTNIAELHTEQPLSFEHSCQEKMSTYYTKIEQLLKETSEEV